jgi:hypothetical protein
MLPAATGRTWAAIIDALVNFRADIPVAVRAAEWLAVVGVVLSRRRLLPAAWSSIEHAEPETLQPAVWRLAGPMLGCDRVAADARSCVSLTSIHIARLVVL